MQLWFLQVSASAYYSSYCWPDLQVLQCYTYSFTSLRSTRLLSLVPFSFCLPAPSASSPRIQMLLLPLGFSMPDPAYIFPPTILYALFNLYLPCIHSAASKISLTSGYCFFFLNKAEEFMSSYPTLIYLISLSHLSNFLVSPLSFIIQNIQHGQN